MYFIAVSLAFASSVAALAVPRATPVGWPTTLESYDTYHDRYMTLGCDLKHDTTFFDQCCHPLLASQEAVPAQCTSPSGINNDIDINDDADDTCHGDTNTQVPSSTPTKPSISTPAPTPVATPAPKTVTPSPTSTTPAAPAPQKSTTALLSTDSTVNTGGYATYFYQNGVAGACGTVHSDNDMIAAIDSQRYGNTGVKSSLCGQQVSITNTDNQQTVVVTIADACPSCNNANSIDLSVAAFEKLASLDKGLLEIKWSFL